MVMSYKVVEEVSNEHWCYFEPCNKLCITLLSVSSLMMISCNTLISAVSGI